VIDELNVVRRRAVDGVLLDPARERTLVNC
jgi:hypothetical protein